MVVEDVSFTYPGRREPALDGVHLPIAAGKTLALVGPSGAGKTTLAHLLLRFWDPAEGVINLDINKTQARKLRLMGSWERNTSSKIRYTVPSWRLERKVLYLELPS